MNKFVSRMIKSGVIRRKYGDKAANNYNRACVEYDCLRSVGITGTSAWLIRDQMKTNRRMKSSKSTRNNARNGSYANPIQSHQSFKKRLMWTILIGFICWPTLIVSLPLLYKSWKKLKVDTD